MRNKISYKTLTLLNKAAQKHDRCCIALDDIVLFNNESFLHFAQFKIFDCALNT